MAISSTAMAGLHLLPITITRISKDFSLSLSQINTNSGVEEPTLKLPAIVCKKNHHRSPCNDRMCGLRGRDVTLLHELEEELQGQFSRLPLTAFPDSSEPGSPRGSQGGVRTFFVNTKGRSKGHRTHDQEAPVASNDSEGTEDLPENLPENLPEKSVQKDSKSTPLASTSLDPSPASNLEERNNESMEEQKKQREEGVSWLDRVRGRLFWVFRTLGTVID